MAVGEGSGEGHRVLLRSLDYPCTARLRLRRLHAYHRRYSHWAVYDAYGILFLDIPCLIDSCYVLQPSITIPADLHRSSQDERQYDRDVPRNWRKASSYLQGFLPFHHPISDEASLLVLTLDDFADGKTVVTCMISDWVLISIYKHPVLARYPCFATFVADVLFQRSDHAKYATAMAEEMVPKMPEIKGVGVSTAQPTVSVPANQTDEGGKRERSSRIKRGNVKLSGPRVGRVIASSWA
ncbi:hypothetical protein EJB05_39384, partial [Eragrostis curvula]